MQRVLVFTSRNETDPIEVRHLESGDINESLVKKDRVAFREVGPCFNLRIRRDKMAANELFKEACTQPKIHNVEKKKQDKNKYTTVLGETKGKVYVQHQDMDTLALRKFRGVGGNKDVTKK